KASRRNLFTFANEAECANDAFIAKVYVIHDHAVHSDEAVAADGGAMNNRAVPHVCALTKNGSHAGEHVNGAIFLDIATIFQYDSAPVSSQRRAGSDVTIFPDDNITRYSSKGMHEG